MNLNGSNIRLVVSPDVPHDIIDSTFEGALIRRMVGVLRTKGGFELWSNSNVENAVTNLEELLELAKSSESRFAVAARPLIEKAIADREYLFLDELGAEIGLDDLDIADVLQELCRMYPDRIDHFEIAWSETTTSATPEFGRHGGGADFITAHGIESINAKAWLDGKRGELDQSREFVPGEIWDQVGGMWVSMILHDNWMSIVNQDAHRYFVVGKLDDGSAGSAYSMAHSNLGTQQHFATLRQAIAAADEWHSRIYSGREQRLLSSMGLDSSLWAIDEDDDLKAVRYAPAGCGISMSYVAEDREWVLSDGDDVLGRVDDPRELAEIMHEAEAAFRH